MATKREKNDIFVLQSHGLRDEDNTNDSISLFFTKSKFCCFFSKILLMKELIALSNSLNRYCCISCKLTWHRAGLSKLRPATSFNAARSLFQKTTSFASRRHPRQGGIYSLAAGPGAHVQFFAPISNKRFSNKTHDQWRF